jgi:hypothetical protein
VGDLPYQLLAGLAGTPIEVELRGAKQVMFVVHAVESDALDRARVARNNAGFQLFVSALTRPATEPIEAGALLGPPSVPGGEGILAMPLSLGIAVTQPAG